MSTARHSGKASGGELEERIDLTEETTTKIAQAQSLPDLSSALTLLFALEKKCRVGNDASSLVRVCEACLQLCRDHSDEEALLNTLKSLSTKRSQKSKAISSLVQKASPWAVQDDGYTPIAVSNDKEKEAREKLIVTLRDITDGKMFLEAERARLTRALAIIKEEEDKIGEASDILQEVHVETYGSLAKREKVEFILEQMRLTLAKKDYIRSHIVSNKIQKKVINEENMQEEKIKYYGLVSEYHMHEKDAFQLAQDYHQIYSTKIIQENETKWKEALECTVLFLVLSPYSNEQQDMMNRLSLDPKLESMDACRETIKLLLRKEIIAFPTPHQSHFESLAIFQSSDPNHWTKIFKTRIIQHNIRIAALYYRRIHGKRLAQLLNLDPGMLEEQVSNMVSDGSIYARIDRPSDIIRFAQAKTPEETLSDYASDIKSLLFLVEKTTHLIHKENMTQ